MAGGDGVRRPPELPSPIRTRHMRQSAIAEQSLFMNTRPKPLKLCDQALPLGGA